MSPSQVLGILVAVVAVSALFVVINRVQEIFNVSHAVRLKFLKASLPTMWAVVIAAFTGVILNMQAVKIFLPVTAPFNQAAAAKVNFIESGTITVSQIILGLYLAGVLIAVFRLALSYLRMRKILLNSSAGELSGRSVRLSTEISSPFSFGFLNSQIFVPASFAVEHSAETTEVMLVHEETHLQNYDPQWLLTSLLTKSVLFFAPSAWYLHQQLELEIEIECDRQTMKKTDLSAKAYGNLLIDAVTVLQTNPMFAYMSNTNLKRRIQAMKSKTFNRPVLSLIFAAVVLAAGVTAIAAAAGVAKGRYRISTQIIVDGKVVSSPQMLVRAGEQAEITMEANNPKSILKMKMTASEATGSEVKDGINLKMDVDYKGEKRNVRVRPRVVLAAGQEGAVAMVPGEFEMKITAVRAE